MYYNKCIYVPGTASSVASWTGWAVSSISKYVTKTSDSTHSNTPPPPSQEPHVQSGEKSKYIVLCILWCIYIYKYLEVKLYIAIMIMSFIIEMTQRLTL